MLDHLILPQTRLGAAWRVLFWSVLIGCIAMLIRSAAYTHFYPEIAAEQGRSLVLLAFALGAGISLPLVTIFFSMALRLTRAMSKLKDIATHDCLTGLLNRNAFEDAVRARQGELMRDGEHEDAILVIDIDHFKSINDRNGHAAGDQVLRMASVCIAGNAFERDFVARIGGEEFAVLLKNCGPNGAAMAAERIRNALSESKTQFEGMDLQITASVGGALFPRGAEYHTTYRSADNALYRAKRNGRNRCDFNGLPLSPTIGDTVSDNASSRSTAR